MMNYNELNTSSKKGIKRRMKTFISLYGMVRGMKLSPNAHTTYDQLLWLNKMPLFFQGSMHST
jgi:hypothetical protein